MARLKLRGRWVVAALLMQAQLLCASGAVGQVEGATGTAGAAEAGARARARPPSGAGPRATSGDGTAGEAAARAGVAGEAAARAGATGEAARAAAEAPNENEAGRRLRLRVGETREVGFAPGTDLAISRRGVIDVYHLGEGKWQITALRAGFVVVDARDAASGAPRLPRLFVDAVGADDEARAGVAAAPVAPKPIPEWLCAGELSCDQSSGLVSGESGSVVRYIHARTACLASAGCFFAAGLSAAAGEAWVVGLRSALGEGYSVAMAGGVPRLEAYCGKGGRGAKALEVDALTNRALSLGLVWFSCREEGGAARYRLSAKIYLVEGGAAAELGFSSSPSVQWTVPHSDQAGASLLMRLQAMAEDHKAEIVGAPVLRLAPNVQAELTSGGEFQVVEHGLRDGRSAEVVDRIEWKQHGLTMRATAVPVSARQVRVAFDMGLRSRSQGSDQALTLHTLKSETDLTLEVPAMVGILDLQASAETDERLPGLSRIPLIGPLFRRSDKHRSNSRLLLWLRLSLDDGGGELGDSLPNIAPQ